MQPTVRVRQTADFEVFRCTGADCEDNCCGDWGVPIDRQTYEKYQTCEDTAMKPMLRELVTISPTKGSDADFGRIALVNNRCPFVAENLCSIQLKLGESWLSHTCKSYPRSYALVDGALERSLHLSCPEAARLVLLNQDVYEWALLDTDPGVSLSNVPVVDSAQANRDGTPYPNFSEVRELFLDVLRSRRYARWERLAIVARLSEELNAILSEDAPGAGETEEFLRRSRMALETAAFEVRRVAEARPGIQIEAVLDLIVARIGSDFTTHRFLECYREFMEGLAWGPQSTMEDLDAHYNEARIRWYSPFMEKHEYLLDNFLINYAMRTVFPYGHRETGPKMTLAYVENAVRRQSLLLAAHYAVVRAVLIGMAAFYGARFGTDNVVKLVQGYAKAFLHSGSYPAQALEILAGHGIHLASEAIVLFQE